MNNATQYQYQIVISGVGGQGVLFVTRLLAEAAIQMQLPIFTSETHGMAQRGGTVISHLKVGDFSSPLIRPGEADGLIALKAEGMEQHGGYLKSGGWAAVNGNAALEQFPTRFTAQVDADQVARDIKDPKSMNLIMLGFTLSRYFAGQIGRKPLFCTQDDILKVIRIRLNKKADLLKAASAALEAGASFTL
jgi:indolepyruvate ferredoxin oxidoreductase beta subunit